MFNSGDKPGKGTYKCAVCGLVVTLEDGQELPVCEVCGATEWSKE